MTGAKLTRVSIQESKNIVQMLSPGFYPKKIQSDIPKGVPFLVLVYDDELSENEKILLDKCTLIRKVGKVTLYKLWPNKLFENTSQQYFQEYKSKKLITLDGFEVSDTLFNSAYMSFDDLKSEKSFRGPGSYKGEKKGDNLLVTFKAYSFVKNEKYVASAWMYNGEKDALNLYFRFVVEERDPQTGKKVARYTAFPEHAETILDDWSMVTCDFEIKNPKNDVVIYTNGKATSKAKLHIDDLLIRNKKTDVYRYDSTRHSLFFNNHCIKLK